MTLTIPMLIFYGGIAGLVVGLAIRSHRLGCIGLLAVPIGMIVYVGNWQAAHPENLRSTSGLDFLFGPLWPSLGAIAGFYVGRMLRPPKVGE